MILYNFESNLFIIDRFISFTFGTYDTDEYQQVHLFLHRYAVDLRLFQHLRTLVIIKMTIDDFPMIQSAISSLEHLVNIRLSVDSEGVDTMSFVHIDNDLLAGPKLKRVKMDMCARTTFYNVTTLSNVEQLSIVWCQMQELTHLLQYSPCLTTLKATICGLNDVDLWTQSICGNLHQRCSSRLNSLKLVIDSIRFDYLLLLLEELGQLRSLWLLLNHYEYLDADKWENLFQTSLTQLDHLDLTIALTKPFQSANSPNQMLMFSPPHIACIKFNTKFWFQRGWRAKLDEYDHCVRLTVSNHALPI
ncbi:unnamed protein product [Adineta ricciae]|uniref:Uncharacterized protein n=1 Tax=Adineta ricciae TaxID=249248 RepID=A0A814QRM6_ADIRI|nr:unnamed protein product [Adineta ricciae]